MANQLRNDILYNEDGTFKTLSGDFSFGDGTVNQVARIVESDDGHRKGYPDLGVGIRKYLGGAGVRSLIEASIIRELKSDGIKNPYVNASDTNNIIVNELTISSDG